MGLVQASGAVVLQQTALDCLCAAVGDYVVGRHGLRRAFFFSCVCSGGWMAAASLPGTARKCARRLLAAAHYGRYATLCGGSDYPDCRLPARPVLDRSHDCGLAGAARRTASLLGLDGPLDGARLSQQI